LAAAAYAQASPKSASFAHGQAAPSSARSARSMARGAGRRSAIECGRRALASASSAVIAGGSDPDLAARKGGARARRGQVAGPAGL